MSTGSNGLIDLQEQVINTLIPGLHGLKKAIAYALKLQKKMMERIHGNHHRDFVGRHSIMRAN